MNRCLLHPSGISGARISEADLNTQYKDENGKGIMFPCRFVFVMLLKNPYPKQSEAGAPDIPSAHRL